MKILKNCLLFSLLALVGSLLVGCGDDAVEKLEQRVDELEQRVDELENPSAIGNLGGLFGKGKESIAKTWVESTGSAYINVSLLKWGQYPTDLKQLLTDKVVTSEKKLKDPWGKFYQYKVPGTHNPESYDLWATTPDGKVIGNWD